MGKTPLMPLSPNFTGQPEAQPESPGPAAEVDRHIGVSSACVRVCVSGGWGQGSDGLLGKSLTHERSGKV